MQIGQEISYRYAKSFVIRGVKWDASFVTSTTRDSSRKQREDFGPVSIARIFTIALWYLLYFRRGFEGLAPLG